MSAQLTSALPGIIFSVPSNALWTCCSSMMLAFVYFMPTKAGIDLTAEGIQSMIGTIWKNVYMSKSRNFTQFLLTADVGMRGIVVVDERQRWSEGRHLLQVGDELVRAVRP